MDREIQFASLYRIEEGCRKEESLGSSNERAGDKEKDRTESMTKEATTAFTPLAPISSFDKLFPMSPSSRPNDLMIH